MRRSRVYVGLILSLLLLGVVCLYQSGTAPVVSGGYTQASIAEEWDSLIASYVNREGITLMADGRPWKGDGDAVYMNAERQLMVPEEAVRELFRCNTAVYGGSRLVICRGDRVIEAELDREEVSVNGEKETYATPFLQKDGTYYVSSAVLRDGLDYAETWDNDARILRMNDNAPFASRLPVAYDARSAGRAPKVRDQGTLGTCWAFAAVGSLEAALLPEEDLQFSVDHMSINNSFHRSQDLGGEYMMAMSYLLSWRGPVLEEDDPYGDGKTDTGLLPVKHVQEARIIPQKDLVGIKEAIFLYGGVQSSLYSALADSESVSEFYNPETASYFYAGTGKMNHDVVLVGWDDNYPRENFNTRPEGNGAFLCMNSWGEGFGDGGYFWVSYFDSGIGIYNIVYTGIEEPDNYDRIYQSDLCGWVGQLGYGSDSAYFANVYTAEEDELLEAVGFYAVGSNTEYEVYVVPKFSTTEDLTFRNKAASGSFVNSGYYTVRLDEAQRLAAGDKFAVLVYLRTPGEERPVAVEYDSEELNGALVDLTDGEGYISLQGSIWQSAEEKQKCNLCLKAYTSAGRAEQDKGNGE